ncbi:hypothetical protein AA309_17775 [Microvirga vignae]|uniref:Uncharacterized protein n=1 Tax=Microvirga vignae TaxID=1225564 RepID=A0A0H1RAI9_9HYPH|nr:hypothetical protein AA309_17775 [Microvirga vignae]
MSDEQMTAFMQKLLRPQVGRTSSMSEEQAKELITSVMSSVINRNRERILARAPLYNDAWSCISQSLENPTTLDELRLPLRSEIKGRESAALPS